MGIEPGGHTEQPDWPRLGPSLVIATCLIVAIRTARRPPLTAEHCADPDLDQEIEFAAYVASRVLSYLLSKKQHLFPMRSAPWYQPDGHDQPK
jgi:hypothetical protein